MSDPQLHAVLVSSQHQMDMRTQESRTGSGTCPPPALLAWCNNNFSFVHLAQNVACLCSASTSLQELSSWLRCHSRNEFGSYSFRGWNTAVFGLSLSGLTGTAEIRVWLGLY